MSTFFTTEIAGFQDLEFITVKSKALKKRADITVYNPCKGLTNLQSVPLVILLHGVYGSHWAWAMKGEVHRSLKQMMDLHQVSPMILAMPSDGLWGDGSGYLRHHTEDYERWITEDVIQVMREQFQEVDESSPVFITGLSMGGYGALRLGAKYPRLFRGFSGLSSITKFEQFSRFVEDFESLSKSVIEREDVLDKLMENRQILPPFRFDCGKEDDLIAANRELHEALKMQEIEHEYEEYPGDHSWLYWKAHIGKSLMFFDKIASTPAIN